MKAQQLMAQLPDAHKAEDVATRFEVRIGDEMPLPRLFSILSASDLVSEFTVERASLESVFLKVIRENDILEEDHSPRRRWRCC